MGQSPDLPSSFSPFRESLWGDREASPALGNDEADVDSPACRHTCHAGVFSDGNTKPLNAQLMSANNDHAIRVNNAIDIYNRGHGALGVVWGIAREQQVAFPCFSSIRHCQGVFFKCVFFKGLLKTSCVPTGRRDLNNI